jgi:hypothetical protein
MGIKSFEGYQMVEQQCFGTENPKIWDAHLKGTWKSEESIFYRLRVFQKHITSDYIYPYHSTGAKHIAELIGCHSGHIEAQNKAELLRKLTTIADDVRPEPTFNGFTYMLHNSRQISEEELHPYQQQFPKTCGHILELSKATKNNNLTKTKSLLEELKRAFFQLLTFQQEQRGACPLCSSGPYAPCMGENRLNFGCTSCLTVFYHQHEYEFDPGGSSDDFYHVPLELKSQLDWALKSIDESSKYWLGTVKARLRVITYSAFLLHLEHWL